MSNGPKLSPVRAHDHPGAVAKVSGSEDDSDESGNEEQPSTPSRAAMRIRSSTRNGRKSNVIETGTKKNLLKLMKRVQKKM